MAKKILTWATVDPDNADEMAEFHLEMYRELLRDGLDDDRDLEIFERMWEEAEHQRAAQRGLPPGHT
jgi:hypothetical protein